MQQGAALMAADPDLDGTIRAALRDLAVLSERFEKMTLRLRFIGLMEAILNEYLQSVPSPKPADRPKTTPFVSAHENAGR